MRSKPVMLPVMRSLCRVRKRSMTVLRMSFAKNIMPETVMERLSILVAAEGRTVFSVVCLRLPCSFVLPSASATLERLDFFGGFAMQHSPGFLKLVQDAKTRIRETNVHEVKKHLDAGEKMIVVDVREESEWARGHLPGAIHLGKGIIERDIEQRIPDRSAPVVLYCGGGFRSALAAANLQKMGYTKVVSMDGGWRGWTEAGFPVTKD